MSCLRVGDKSVPVFFFSNLSRLTDTTCSVLSQPTGNIYLFYLDIVHCTNNQTFHQSGYFNAEINFDFKPLWGTASNPRKKNYKFINWNTVAIIVFLSLAHNTYFSTVIILAVSLHLVYMYIYKAGLLNRMNSKYSLHKLSDSMLLSYQHRKICYLKKTKCLTSFPHEVRCCRQSSKLNLERSAHYNQFKMSEPQCFGNGH